MARREVSILLLTCLFMTAGNSALAASSDKGWISLFDGKTLDGWVQINGTAKYEVKDGTILGTTVKGSPNSFLCTKKHYSDFELEFEVKLDSRLNSGVQIRSNSFKEYRDGRVHGYQVEISTNGSAGFIYDEARGFRGDPPAWVQWRNIRIRQLKAGDTREPVKVVVITGGHGFEHDPFFKIFDEIKEINYIESVQKDHSELFEDISDWDYDVMVFYNMTQEISEKRRKNFLKLLDKPVGVVALHHTMGAYQAWPEFKKIIGAKYYLKDVMEDGVPRKKGSYKHGLDVTVHVKDQNHPVTKGMSDFTIHDETYKNCWFDKSNHVLLTTDHATSDPTIGWVREHGKAKVVTIQLGHDSKAYNNSNYRQLVKRAILWTAGKL